MTEDRDPTVAHGEDGPSGDRKAQNHGGRESEPSAPRPVPSAPPGVSSLGFDLALDLIRLA